MLAPRLSRHAPSSKAGYSGAGAFSCFWMADALLLDMPQVMRKAYSPTTAMEICVRGNSHVCGA